MAILVDENGKEVGRSTTIKLVPAGPIKTFIRGLPDGGWTKLIKKT